MLPKTTLIQNLSVNKDLNLKPNQNNNNNHKFAKLFENIDLKKYGSCCVYLPIESQYLNNPNFIFTKPLNITVQMYILFDLKFFYDKNFILENNNEFKFNINLTINSENKLNYIKDLLLIEYGLELNITAVSLKLNINC